MTYTHTFSKTLGLCNIHKKKDCRSCHKEMIEQMNKWLEYFFGDDSDYKHDR